MINAGITVTTGSLVACAGSLRETNNRLYEELQAMKKSMNSTQDTWQSDAGEAIRQRFNDCAPKFDTYKDIINSYAEYLVKTAAEYERVEDMLKGNADQFK